MAVRSEVQTLHASLHRLLNAEMAEASETFLFAKCPCKRGSRRRCLEDPEGCQYIPPKRSASDVLGEPEE